MAADQDTFELEGPMGTKARARGPGAMLALLIVVCCTGVIAVIWAHHQQSAADHAETKQELSEMVYVLSLSVEDRAKLNLSMPESLRRKVRSQRRDEQ